MITFLKKVHTFEKNFDRKAEKFACCHPYLSFAAMFVAMPVCPHNGVPGKYGSHNSCFLDIGFLYIILIRVKISLCGFYRAYGIIKAT